MGSDLERRNRYKVSLTGKSQIGFWVSRSGVSGSGNDGSDGGGGSGGSNSGSEVRGVRVVVYGGEATKAGGWKVDG